MEGDALYSDMTLVVLRTAPFGALRISGFIDHHNAEAVGKSLMAELSRTEARPQALGKLDGDVHLDVAQLEFADVSGLKAIVDASRAATTARLIVRGLPAQIVKVLAIVGWSDLPNLVVDES
jgi:anti-anti-sigma regulatory factor